MSRCVAYCEGFDSLDLSVTETLFPGADYIAYPDYENTFRAVLDWQADFAVMPFEKSLGGEVGAVMDLIFDGSLFINRVVSADNDTETVRYAILSRQQSIAADVCDSIILMFTLKNEPGTLARAIGTIADHGFNLRTLRSRPMHDIPWHNYFYTELDGDDRTVTGRQMLADLRIVCETIKVAGRFHSE